MIKIDERCVVIMIRVSSVQRCMQSKLVFEAPGDNLEDNHLVKLIVYLVNE